MEVFFNCCFIMTRLVCFCLTKGWSALECIGLAAMYKFCCKGNKISDSTKNPKNSVENQESSVDKVETTQQPSNQSIWEKMSTKVNTANVTFKVQSPLLIVKNPPQSSDSEVKDFQNKWSKVVAHNTVMYPDNHDIHLAGNHSDEHL